MAMTKCRECGAQISTKAEACPNCGAKRKSNSGCGTLIGAAVLIVVALALIGQCSSNTSPTPSNSATQTSPSNAAAAAVTQPQASSPSAPAAAPQPGLKWDYRQDKDPMGKGTAYFASVLSNNTVNFGFPYSGPQHATLTLRTHPRYGQNVILSIERGQFLCPSYDGCTVLVRFDDGKAIRYSGAGADDNSTETVFIRGYSGFVAHLEKSKRVRISANVNQEGAPVFEFDVSGFDASKYKPGK